MWATVLVLALMAASDPVRLGIVLLLISRPRPMPNLFMYWLGAMIIGVVTVLIFLVGMRDLLPSMIHKLVAIAARPAVQHVQIVVGLLMLPIAASIAVGFSLRQRSRAQVTREAASALALQQRPPSAVEALARLVGFAQNALKSGSPWVAFVVGLGSGPPPAECVGAFVVILASGTSTQSQVAAGLAFVVVMLVAFEMTLISYLVIPAQTQAVVVRLHDWLRTHRHHIFALIVAALGLGLVSNGVGGS